MNDFTVAPSAAFELRSMTISPAADKGSSLVEAQTVVGAALAAAG